MKFALHLRENLVPEWRDQYLDYKGGKKKLKKLTKSSIPASSQPHVINTSQPPPNNNSATQETTESDANIVSETSGNETSHESVRKTDPLHRSAEYGTIDSGDASTSDSIKLPSPALYHGKTLSSPPPTKQAQEQLPNIHDRSPLLTPRNQGRTASAIPETNRMAVVEEMGKVSAEREFLHWLDNEIIKIETFYMEKEYDAIEKFLILQDQLHKLQLHRRNSKRKRTTTLNRAAKNTKILILKRIGVPSLPVIIHNWFFTNKEDVEHSPHDVDHSGTTGADRSKDYIRTDSTKVAYSDAKRQVKAALSEYYRSLELLKGFRALNQTGIRKMVKKFDKTTHRAESANYAQKVADTEFAKSDVLDNLVVKTENMYAQYFESGNHKQAVEKLRSKLTPDPHYSEMYVSGLFLGMSVPLFVQALYVGIKHLVEGTYPDTTYLFQVWGGFFIVNLMLILFTLNLYAWTKFKINYPFIFEFDQRHFLDYRQYGEIPAFLMFLLSLFAWLTFNDFVPDSYPARYFPPIYLGLAVFIWVVPLPILHYRSRRWLLIAFWRLLLSGLYPVEFRDFFLGDIVTSMTYSVSNASFFFCLYSHHWGDVYPGSPKVSKCSSSHSRLLGFLNCLPAIWRLFQCLRRYGDTADWFPHLANAGKYSFQVLYYVFLSVLRISQGKSDTYRALFITFACISAVYSSIWDVFMDFSFLQPGSKNFLLRDELGFPSRIPYYVVLVVDPILRFSWVFYAAYSTQIQQSAKISFIVALIEIIRRFLWVFFRVENEHCTNVTRYRASRDLTLPYPLASRMKETFKESGEDQERAQTSALDSQKHVWKRSATTPFDVLQRRDEEAQYLHELRHRRTSEPEQTPSSRRLQRRGTIAAFATPVLLAVAAAHARDFERRTPYADEDEDEEDDEDEDTEEENDGSNGTTSHS